MPTLHLNLASDIDGDVHAHMRPHTLSATFTSGTPTTENSATTITADMISADIAAILDRFTRYDSSAPVHVIYKKMTELGWTPYAPAVRVEGKAPEAYIRWVRLWPKGTRVTLYQETRTLGTGNNSKHFFHVDYSIDVESAVGELENFMTEISKVDEKK